MITKAIFKHQEASHLDQNLNFECFGYQFPTPCLEDILFAEMPPCTLRMWIRTEMVSHRSAPGS